MSEIKGRSGLDDLVLREADPNNKYGQFCVSSPEPRAMFTDEDGKDYDVEAMRDALIAIQANTAPTAISLSLKNRIRAIYQICCQVLPE